MADVDTKILAKCPNYTTCLAAYLNSAMARSPENRARYAALYGYEWAPLGNGEEINDSPSTTAVTVR